ncbi:MAG: 1-acyl-sn-glycerol-3-phosphate acyltransferase [Leptospiraceae bacterium]|nr:1-acyl-sn-glycerol-3-phosphate acyltransferase [Leptospiraceae bacterium]MCP5502335.1 1-acyl-sn-glycerol-3-phosphate acyltransferase [Leptospiraceae bacterium]
MKYFMPPEFKAYVAWFADLTLPVALKIYQNIEDIIISDEDKAMLRSLENKRVLFFTNHPSQAEPMIAYHIANMMCSRFNYMATRRAFDFIFGALGKLYQSLGGFSIIPGIADKDSMKTARSILASDKGKLVLFPEGEPMCGENDNLMPFQPGIVKLSLGAFEDARKQDPNADIVILPGFIKYVIKSPDNVIVDDLMRSIRVIERKLGADAGDRNLLRRFMMVGRLLLEKAEEEYGIEVDENAEYNYRVGKIRHVMLDNVAEKIGIQGYNKDADAITKLRFLTSVLELVELKYPNSKVPKLTDTELAWANRECVKAYDMIVIKRDYLLSWPSPERFYEYLNRYESFVLGRTPHALGGEPAHLPRKAHVVFAKPFLLSEYYEAYKKNRTTGLDSILQRLNDDLRRLMNNTKELTRCIIQPYDMGDTAVHDFH